MCVKCHYSCQHDDISDNRCHQKMTNWQRYWLLLIFISFNWKFNVKYDERKRFDEFIINISKITDILRFWRQNWHFLSTDDVISNNDVITKIMTSFCSLYDGASTCQVSLIITWFKVMEGGGANRPSWIGLKITIKY